MQAPERVGFKDYGLEGLRVGIRVPMTYVEIRVSGFHDFAQVCRFFMNYVRFGVSINVGIWVVTIHRYRDSGWPGWRREEWPWMQ